MYMGIAVKICKYINKLFPLPIHPFNLKNSGIKTYSQWQFEKGKDTIQFYLNKTNIEEMFKDKTVLDIGCGAGGKTVYYASLGVKKIFGLEILNKYRQEAVNLAKEKGFLNIFDFVCGDAAKMEFQDNMFDTIIMNDSMEHVDKPIEVLEECYRVLKPGGKLFLNFPPYYHPLGAHLSDAIGIPWVHCFFSEKTLLSVYKDLVNRLSDGIQRIQFRISLDENGNEYFSYINKMSIKKFIKIINKSRFNILYYNEVPLRKIFGRLAKLPIINEFLVKMVVCILEK